MKFATVEIGEPAQPSWQQNGLASAPDPGDAKCRKI